MANKAKNPVDSAIEKAESGEQRTRGPRDRYFFCAAIGDITELVKNDDGEEEEVTRDGVVHEVIKATSEKEARASFQEMYDLEAEVCETGADLDGGGNGFYLAMGTGMSSVQRVTVTVTPAQLMRRTTKAVRAKLHIDGHDHPLYGSGLRALEAKIGSDSIKFKDNDLFAVEFEDIMDENGKKIPKPKLKKREVVRASDLKDIEAVT
jgi:hypothetical protein